MNQLFRKVLFHLMMSSDVFFRQSFLIKKVEPICSLVNYLFHFEFRFPKVNVLLCSFQFIPKYELLLSDDTN